MNTYKTHIKTKLHNVIAYNNVTNSDDKRKKRVKKNMLHKLKERHRLPKLFHDFFCSMRIYLFFRISASL